jgi:hypothetical protein
MDVIIGIWIKNKLVTTNGPEHDMVISSPKARDVGFNPFPIVMSGCGWFKSNVAVSIKVAVDGDGLGRPDTIEDIVY